MAVTSSTENGAQELGDVRVRYLVTRAALRAAKAMTEPGLEPQQRLATLMECHGTLHAARGPGILLPFGGSAARSEGIWRPCCPTVWTRSTWKGCWSSTGMDR